MTKLPPIKKNAFEEWRTGLDWDSPESERLALAQALENNEMLKRPKREKKNSVKN